MPPRTADLPTLAKHRRDLPSRKVAASPELPTQPDSWATPDRAFIEDWLTDLLDHG